jgi:hypothetical protein
LLLLAEAERDRRERNANGRLSEREVHV